jgi:SRSO17 transposase
LGQVDGVLVIDPSGVLKQGKASVGVARQWCGRAGKVDNCQVGVYLGYVTRKEHLGRYAVVLAQGVDEGQTAMQAGRGAEGDSLSHTSRTDVGNAS